MGRSNKKRRELFDSSDEEEDEEVEFAPPSKKEGILKVNKTYAKEFNDRKRREELANCHVDEEESSSSDESEEDEFADLLTPQLDIKIFQTINAIRRRDERLYDPNIQIFQQQEEDQGESKKKAKHSKLLYKDVVREQILEQMDSDEEKRDVQKETTGGLERLAYDEEQRQIRDSFLKSVADADDGEDDALLVVKKKQAAANAVLSLQEEDALRREIEAMGQDTLLQDPRGEISDGTKFLQEYMLHRKWVDPTEYDDQSSSSTEQQEEKHAAANSDNENEDESSLEDLERMDEFESKYNFRFEEAIAENDTSRYNIVSYARGAAVDSLRRIDDTRKQKRRIKEERKAAERKAKEEQLRRLKNARKIELQEKLKQIRAVVGNASEALEEETLSKLMEGDFDPDKFSQIMQEAYGDDFYAKEDDMWKTDKDVKQTLVTDPEFLEEYYDEKGDYYYNYDDEENASIVQDAAETEEDENGGDEETFGEETFEEETFEEEEESKLDQQLKQKMLDEMYKLDFEDIIGGDIKCRFKYRRVEPNSYGLSCEEILFANDSTLKQFVSLKAMNPYRDTVSTNVLYWFNGLFFASHITFMIEHCFA